MEVKVKVEYYNKSEKENFRSYPNTDDISRNIGEISISKDELMTYMMFTKQDDRSGWRTFSELNEKISGALGNVEEFLVINEDGIKSLVNSNVLNEANFTEKVGVAVGLCVINKIHGLTEADWNKTEKKYIDGVRQKDMDYEMGLTSDGTRFIQVENKGVVNKDNSLKTGASDKYRDIRDKKNTVKSQGENTDKPTNVYYGTITVLDQFNQGKMYLVDPPPNEFSVNAEKYRLLQRLEFYLELFSQINLDKNFLGELRMRIRDIGDSKDFYSFNMKNIRSKRMSEVLIPERNGFIASTGSSATFVGVFYKGASKDRLSFQMVPIDLLIFVMNQDFAAILKYSTLDILSDLIEFNLGSNFENIRTKGFEHTVDNFYKFNGNVYSSSSGRIFGVVKS